MVDARTACDQNKLNWLQTNQGKIRTDLYNGLADALRRGDENMDEFGCRILLPSSYYSGVRHIGKR